MKDTRSRDYADFLRTRSEARWKRWLDVQAPYRWNLRRQGLGRTLEVGCGRGRNLVALDRRSVGVDHNAVSVADARGRGFTALTSEEWVASDLRVRGSFDSLLFAHVVEHMSESDATSLVLEYLPYLKPNGSLFFICPQERGYDTDPTHVRFTDLHDLAELSRAVGLAPVRSFSFPFPRRVGTFFTYNESCLLATKPSEAAEWSGPLATADLGEPVRASASADRRRPTPGRPGRPV